MGCAASRLMQNPLGAAFARKVLRCRARCAAAPGGSASASLLERNVVVHILEGPPAALLGRGFGISAAGFDRRRLWLARHRLRTAAAAAQKLHAIGYDLSGIFLLPLLVLPFSGSDAAFNIDRRAFLQIFAGDFREFSEERNAMPLGMLLLLAALIFPDLGGCDANVGHRISPRQLPRFRIRA